MRKHISLPSLVSVLAVSSVVAVTTFMLNYHASFASHTVPTYEECEAQGGRITICHATSSEENPYVEITVACEALYGNGNAGHFDENGTTQAGHEDDFVPHDGQTCANPTGPSPSPTPTASVEPTPASSPSPTANPTPTPAAPPAVGGTSGDSGRRTVLANDNLQCNNTSFDAVMDVFENGTAQENILVRFSYNGSTKEARTNSSGRARVIFDINGNGTVTAVADGYPSQSMNITVPFCSNVVLDPNKNTSSTTSTSQSTQASQQSSSSHSSSANSRGQGQVLGATTLADTGREVEYLGIAFLASGLTISSFALYGLLKK
jgi:hypothetical protein